MHLATTLYSIPKKSLADRFRLARKANLQGVRVSNMDMDFSELQAVVEAERVAVTSVEVQKDWRPFNGSRLPEKRDGAEKVFLNAVGSGVPHGFTAYSTSLESGFLDEVASEQLAGLRICVSNVLKDDRSFEVLIRPRINDVFYKIAETAEHATELMIHYLDWFHTSKIALDFDVGNHSMYGDAATAIKTLGGRIRTITVTSYNRQAGKLCSLFDCDLDWKSIGEALRQIRFDGFIVLSFRGANENDFLSQVNHFQKNVFPLLLR